MAKFDWGFEIANKPTHAKEKCVEIRCTRTNTMTLVAWGRDLPVGQEWGDVVWSDMKPQRQHDALCALRAWGYI